MLHNGTYFDNKGLSPIQSEFYSKGKTETKHTHAEEVEAVPNTGLQLSVFLAVTSKALA